MASSTQLEFVKVLACLAWADEEVTNAELNFIKQFVRRFNFTGEEWTAIEMYLIEPVGVEEMRRVTRRFLSRVRRPKDRRMIVEAVKHLLQADEKLTDREREWMEDLQETVSGARRAAFLFDGLKSLLRTGATAAASSNEGREADLHDFIHNRVLFRLRRRLGPRRLEREGTPEKLKKLSLSSALLARVGYVDNAFLPQEEAFMRKLLRENWGVSAPMAEAVTEIAIASVRQGLDLYRMVQEVKETMSVPERRRLLEGIFALSLAAGKMSHEEIEEIRKIAFMLDFTHRQFIDAKLRVLKR